MENSCSPGCRVAGGVFYGVFCAVLFPLDVLGGIWDLIESVSEGFLTYSCLYLANLYRYTILTEM